MKLTGKVKIEFEKWLFNYYYNPELKSQITAKLNVASFFNRDLATQIGVYQLYFDSVGIDTGTVKNHTGTFNNWGGHSIKGAMESVKTREQAWKQAVERANKIREKQLK